MIQKRGITTGAEWRKTREEGVAVPLPSGKVAKLRNVRIARLLMGGLISDTLTPIVVEMLNGESGEKKLSKMPTKDILAASNALKEALCKEAFVEPRIVDTPTQDNEISIEDLSEEDQEFVMTLLYTSVERLAERFPPGPIPDVSPVAEGQTIQATSE